MQEFGLLAENLPVFQLWCEVQTAWRISPSGHPVGISWSDVRAHPATRRIGRKDREEVLEGVAVMERAWLAKRAEIDKERASA